MTEIREVRATAYRIPTDAPEADGTFAWTSTTMVVVEARAAGRSGWGWSYTGAGAARLIADHLAPAVVGADALDVVRPWVAMGVAIRNLGRSGVAATAIAAVDAALWDVKARILEVPLCALLGRARDRVPLYGSGGFTTYDDARLRDQIAGWRAQGIGRVKIKVGRHPEDDLRRARIAAEAAGDAALFVDANGAWTRKQALGFAEALADLGVRWLEEPVSSDDLDGLRWIRDRGPAGLDIAAGEYGYDLPYFRRMLESGAVDVLQADATRCLGISGFLRVSALCEAWGIPLSAHCAPLLHLHPACAAPTLAHVEYFHDHARIESELFDGCPSPIAGELAPDLSRPGIGADFKRADADRWQIG